MRILITGAAGFIGSRLASRLLARGDQVAGLDNMNDFYPLVHKRRNLADLEKHKNFQFIQGDLRDENFLNDLLQRSKPEAIAHIAAMASVRYSVNHPHIYAGVNVQGTLNLLDAARQIGKPHCLLASTGSVYGQSTPVPFPETAAADRPLAPYPASKRSMELFAHSYAHIWGMPVTILRFFNVYGPHGRPDMMPWQWTIQILSGEPLTLFNAGHLKRDWTYIDDLLDGFLAALDSPSGYRVYNLGCGNPVENIEFVQVLEKLIKRKAVIKNVPSPASEPPITFADISKARAELGYNPRVLVPEGLEKFLAWMKNEKLI
ncbi:MAG TPA: GDP-mannose 4,6-dehydratase [Phycisphaerae bacterium]|nr:GDP-mannose 4,6-dehydratase [Phycisphaerae bacterium]